jgi:hypothetical protein
VESVPINPLLALRASGLGGLHWQQLWGSDRSHRILARNASKEALSGWLDFDQSLME